MTRRAKLIVLVAIIGLLYPPFLVFVAALTVSALLVYGFFWAVIRFDELLPRSTLETTQEELDGYVPMPKAHDKPL